MTCEVEGRIATIRRSDTTQALLVAPLLLRHIVDSREVVLYVLSRVVARNLVEPLLTERRQATTVRCHYDIALCCHKLEVPTIAPELRNYTLRATLTVEQCRILLCLVKVRWKDNPSEHLLAVGSCHPALLDLAHLDIVVDSLIYVCELLHLSALEVEFEHLRRHRNRHHRAYATTTANLERVDVVVALSQHLNLARLLNFGGADLVGSLDWGDKVHSFLAIPHHICCVVVEIFSYIINLA